MLYLEDYLEFIENLNNEFTDKYITIGELDRTVESSQQKIDEDVKTFFGNAKKMKTADRETTHQSILKKYANLMEVALEKQGIAKEMSSTFLKYMKKVDQELEKFKCELEADSPGVTEILEKKSLEMDEPMKDSQKENRHSSSRTLSNSHGNTDWRSQAIKKEEADFNLSSNLSLSPQASMSYSLGAIGSGNNVIAAAASQAIAATQQIRQGRKAASFLDSSSNNVFGPEFPLGTELAHAAKAALAASSLSQESTSYNSAAVGTHINKRQKKSQRSVSGSISNCGRERTPSPIEETPLEPIKDSVVDNPDWNVDPSEPRYCICNTVSYGDMVACDNPKCPMEWFHYACVGINSNPKGKWYCPPCIQIMKQRPRK